VGLALRNALIGLRCLCQGVRLDNRFDLSSLRNKRLVEILGAVLLAADYSNALRNKVDERNRKRLGVGTHCDKPAIRPQPRMLSTIDFVE
jgi:hypothetical protein